MKNFKNTHKGENHTMSTSMPMTQIQQLSRVCHVCFVYFVIVVVAEVHLRHFVSPFLYTAVGISPRDFKTSRRLLDIFFPKNQLTVIPDNYPKPVHKKNAPDSLKHKSCYSLSVCTRMPTASTNHMWLLGPFSLWGVRQNFLLSMLSTWLYLSCSHASQC